MRASVTCLLVLAVGVTACERQRTDNPLTERTAAAAEPAPAEPTQQQTQKKEEPKKADTAAKSTDEKADQIRKDADAKAEHLKKDADERCDALKKHAEAEGDRLKKAANEKVDRLKAAAAAPPKAKTTAGAKHAKVGKGVKAKERAEHPATREEPTGKTTVTGAEVPRGRPAQPEQAPPQGAMPPPPQPGAAEQPYVNHSTVLGDGKSGMYTDGQGTYGGRATWGTGTPRR